MTNNYARKTFLAIIILGALSLLPGWMEDFYDRYILDHTPAIVEKIVITNKDKTVCQGGMLLYDVYIDKLRDLSVRVKRQIVNSYVITYSPLEPPQKPLGKQVVRNHLYVPKNAESGDWFLRWTAEYDVSPKNKNEAVRIIAVSKDSDAFWVVECK